MVTGGLGLAERVRHLYEAREYGRLLSEVQALGLDDFLAQPEVGFHAADAMWRVGEVARSLKLGRALLEPVREQASGQLLRNLLNLLGVLQFESGDLPESERTFLELLCTADETGDDNFAARANNNLGIIYTVRGQAHEAVASYERALSAYRQLGYRRGLAQTHHNLAITYRELGAVNDADHHFQEAIEYARADGSEDEIARAEQERALLILEHRGDAELAEVTARSALQRFQSLGHPPGIGDAHRVLSIIAFARGQHEAAIGLLEPALRIAGDTPSPLLEAECLEVLAAILLSSGNRKAGSELRQRARELFHGLGADAWGVRCRSMLERLAGS